MSDINIDLICIIVILTHIFYGKKATHAHIACMITKFTKSMKLEKAWIAKASPIII